MTATSTFKWTELTPDEKSEINFVVQLFMILPRQRRAKMFQDLRSESGSQRRRRAVRWPYEKLILASESGELATFMVMRTGESDYTVAPTQRELVRVTVGAYFEEHMKKRGDEVVILPLE